MFKEETFHKCQQEQKANDEEDEDEEVSQGQRTEELVDGIFFWAYQ